MISKELLDKIRNSHKYLQDNLKPLFNEMIEGIDVSIQYDAEAGFIICERDLEFIPFGHCMGTICDIDLSEDCKEGDRVGTYHSHGKGFTKPSIGDFYASLKHSDKILCVGAYKDVTIEVNSEKIKVPAYHITCITFNQKHRKYREAYDKILKTSEEFSKLEDVLGRMVYIEKKVPPKELMGLMSKLYEEFGKLIDSYIDEGVINGFTSIKIDWTELLKRL